MSNWLSFSLPNPFKSDDPQPNHTTPPSNEMPPFSQAIIGIKNDLLEITGSLSRFTSTFFPFQNNDDDDEETVGITEEVVGFVGEVSLWADCWTDFPLSLPNEFNMSEVQEDHAATIEHLVPSLASLRHKLRSYMSDEQFWMIYFILLLPRLNENDSKLLSTPEIVEARETLLQKLLNKRNAAMRTSENSQTVDTYQDGGQIRSTRGNETTSQQKEALAEVVNALQETEIDDHENTEPWLEEEDDDAADTFKSIDACKQHEKEEDVSFSDLEDDDNDLSGRLSGFRNAPSNKVSSTGASSEWVRLGENSRAQGGWQNVCQSTSMEKDSEDEESNDWFTVDDVDLDR